MVKKSKSKTCYEDLNQFLDDLRVVGDLIEVNESVSPKFTIGAILSELGEGSGQAALFNNVTDYQVHTVAGNLLGHRRRIARVLGVTEDEIARTYVERKSQPLAPKRVKNSPLKEVTYEGEEIDLLKILPALTHHEKDASPYLTTGIIFGKDPVSGSQSMGLHRIQILDRLHMAMELASPPISVFAEKTWNLNKPFEIAIVVGPDPAVTIASVTRALKGEDKIEIAGGFRQKAVEMVACNTVDLAVPAKAQYLIEGVIEPNATAHEGPFGDSTGTYLEKENPMMKVTSVSHRIEPIFQALQSWSSEDSALLNLCFSSDLLEEIKVGYPFVRDLHMVSGTLFSHIVAATDPNTRSARRSAMTALLNGNPFVKQVIFVNDDINIRDIREVEWAVATRFQADRDILMLNDVTGSPIDPSVLPDGTTSKIGIDATYPSDEIHRFEKIAVPEHERVNARRILEKYLNSSARS